MNIKKYLISLIWLILFCSFSFAGGDTQMKLSTLNGSTGLWIEDSSGIVISTVASNGDSYFKQNVGIGKEASSYALDINGKLSLIDSGSKLVLVDGSEAVTLDTLGIGNSLKAVDGSPVDVVYVDTAGNVGINTTSPSNGKLHVQGTSYLQASPSLSADKYLEAKDIRSLGANGLKFYNDGGTAGIFLNNSEAKIGIGTISPDAVLHIEDTAVVPSDFLLKVKIGADEVFNVQADGNVGIGTDSTVSIFAVGEDAVNVNENAFQIDSSGNITKINELIYSWPSSHGTGYLKNDGSGNLTWESVATGVGGSGNTNYISKFTDTTTLGNSVIYQSASNVAIGGTTPGSYKLYVNGTQYVNGDLTVLGSVKTDKIKAAAGEGVCFKNQAGTIYVASINGYLYAIKDEGTSGSEKWQRYIGGSPVEASITIGQNGIIYAASTNGTLYAIKDKGTSSTQEWTFAAGGNIVSSPSVGEDGTIYFGASDGYLYALDSNGNEKWKYNTGGNIKSSPAIDKAGIIYFGSSNGYVYAIKDYTSYGNHEWSRQLGDS